MGYYIIEPRYDEILIDAREGVFVEGGHIHSDTKEHLITWIKNILHSKMLATESTIASGHRRLDKYMVMVSNLNDEARADRNEGDTK